MPGRRNTSPRRTPKPGTGARTVQTPEHMPNTRPRSAVKPRSVPCPDCKVPTGQPCLRPDGTPRPAVHTARQRMAARAWWAAQEQGEAALQPVRWRRSGWHRFTGEIKGLGLVLDVWEVSGSHWLASLTRGGREVWRAQAPTVAKAKRLVEEEAARKPL